MGDGGENINLRLVDNGEPGKITDQVYLVVDGTVIVGPTTIDRGNAQLHLVCRGRRTESGAGGKGEGDSVICPLPSSPFPLPRLLRGYVGELEVAVTPPRHPDRLAVEPPSPRGAAPAAAPVP